MNIKRLAWIIGAAIFILIVNVGLSVLYMVFYSYFINPGHGEQFYQDHVKVAAPVCSIVFGIPLFYFVCRWIGGRREKDFAVKAAISVWIVYALIDLTALVASGLTLWIAGLVTVSLITKLISAYFGGLSASNKPEQI
jgi:hypothetical protein